MARATWSGSLSFGLVTIPVALFPATKDRTVHFHQLQAGTADRIHYRRVNERTGREVDYDDIVKGSDVGGGEYVVLSPDELRSVAPDQSSTIEVSDFVDLDDIDPLSCRATYYLAPRDGSAAKAYGVLRAAMERTGKAGVATFVMREREHLCAVRPRPDVLVLETLYFADEIRDPLDVVPDLADLPRPSARELQVASQLIESLGRSWDPSAYHDTYREKVEALIARKRRGEDVVVHDDGEEPAPVIDLMAALEASVARTRPGREVDPTSLRKADLYREATRLGVPGRSSMTRQQLLDAVTKATSKAGRRAS